MKELWLVCDSSLYSELIDRNEQRVNAGEIDFLLFPSEVFPFNSCKLPQDLHDRGEIEACVRTGFRLQTRLTGAFTDLAEVDPSHYDRIVVCSSGTANETMFECMISYFIDSPIFLLCNDGHFEELTPEHQEEMAMFYQRYTEQKQDVVAMIKGRNICIIPVLDFRIILTLLPAFHFEKIEEIVSCFKGGMDFDDQLHPMYVASLMKDLACNGYVNVRPCDLSRPSEDLSTISLETFYSNYEVNTVSIEDQECHVKELKEKMTA